VVQENTNLRLDRGEIRT